MGSAAHVFVDDLCRPELSDEDRHHLERVLRLRPGEEVTAADGRGGWRRLRYGAAGTLEPLADLQQRPAAQPAVTVAFALTKGQRPEWTVQKLTESGVDRIVPFVTPRSVVRWDGEKGARQVERLRAIARAAAMQSRQARIPEVTGVVDFAAAVGLAGPAAALAHPGGDPPGLDRPAVLVGPEGGFNDEELSCGLATVGLGVSVLRAETAALAVGILLCALRANLVRPAG
jgi:16S rRNA (uracil1498-N3)-methyltransferase